MLSGFFLYDALAIISLALLALMGMLPFIVSDERPRGTR
jgi:hypothetical protein